MSRRLAHHRLTAAFLLVTAAAAGCAGEVTESEDPAVGSSTVSSSLSSSFSSPPSSLPSSPHSSPLLSPAPPPSTAPTSPPVAAPPFVDSATWGDSDYGITLRVTPTPSTLRAGGPDDAAIAWGEVLRLAPGADTPGMREQFDCHWTWARLLEPDKPTWNLEPWRPVIPVEVMVLEGCNPGGPEV